MILLSPAGRSGSRPFARASAPANSWPGTTESRGASSGMGGSGTGSSYAAPSTSDDALPLATTVAPDSRTRAAASITAGSASSRDAIVQTGNSGSSAATGPCARSVAVNGSAATRHVSVSFSATSRAVANSIPRIVLGAIFTVAFGFGMQSKVLLAVVLVFFGVFFNAFQGTREVDRNLMSNARILGASRWQVTRQVVLPSAFTWILASLHVSFGFALIGAIVGELLGADHGLGLLIRSAQNNFNMNGVLAGMVLIAIIALVAEFLITLLEKRILRWRPPQAGSASLDVI